MAILAEQPASVVIRIDDVLPKSDDLAERTAFRSRLLSNLLTKEETRAVGLAILQHAQNSARGNAFDRREPTSVASWEVNPMNPATILAYIELGPRDTFPLM